MSTHIRCGMSSFVFVSFFAHKFSLVFLPHTYFIFTFVTYNFIVARQHVQNVNRLINIFCCCCCCWWWCCVDALSESFFFYFFKKKLFALFVHLLCLVSCCYSNLCKIFCKCFCCWLDSIPFHFKARTFLLLFIHTVIYISLHLMPWYHPLTTRTDTQFIFSFSLSLVVSVSIRSFFPLSMYTCTCA